jgi:cell division septation protein DedD
MPRNEEGEFELVLGNRQLLSVFFIVVVLLGVFFVMGYILGKNSSPVPGAEVTTAQKSDGPPTNPLIIDKSGSAPKSSAAGEPVATKTAEKPVEKSEPKNESAAEPEKKAEKKKKEEPKKEEPERAAEGGTTKTGLPPKGSQFMQVAAVGRAEADVVAKVLRGKGLPVWIAPTDKDAIFRVLVGPIQTEQKAKTRETLEGLGFKPFPRSY